MNNLPIWITAIATSLAVIVALFKEDILFCFNKPKIEFILGNKDPFVVYGNKEKDLKYFRIKIKNKGKTIAKNCSVRLIVVYPYENFNPAISDPVTLKWSASPLDNRYLIPQNPPMITHTLKPIFREKIDIAPFDGWELCDLFKITKTRKTINFISVQDENRNMKITGKDYLVYIRISGDNFKSETFKFLVKDNQDWDKISVENIK
jgi:hypothetical protein